MVVHMITRTDVFYWLKISENLTLSKARKYVNSFVRIGHVNLFKVSGHVKGIMKFFGG